MEAMQQHLLNSGVEESDLKDKIIPRLWVKGFRKIADLEYLERQDLDGKTVVRCYLTIIFNNCRFRHK